MEPTAVIERCLALIADPSRTSATRVVWRGTLAVAAGPMLAGTRLTAHSAMWFEARDGRIARQA